MPKTRECRARGGVMYCKNPRCPERVVFFGDLEVAHRAQDARDHIATMQAVLREQGLKMNKIIGVQDLLPDVAVTHKVWSKKDYKRLQNMLGDGNHIAGKTVDIPINSIGSVRQQLVKFSALHHYLKHDDRTRTFGHGAFNNDNLPVVVRNGNQLALVDGTHRYVTAALLGDTHLRVVLTDLA